jgi:hypothetical protein
LAAVRVTYKCSRQTSFENIPVSSYSGQVLLRLVDILKKMSNIFEAYGVEEFAELFLASTSPNFRHLGITTEIYKLAKNRNIITLFYLIIYLQEKFGISSC